MCHTLYFSRAVVLRRCDSQYSLSLFCRAAQNKARKMDRGHEHGHGERLEGDIAIDGEEMASDPTKR